MTDYELKNVDPEDIEDLLVKVEASFGIEFIGDELVHIETFGQLCDHIADKIQLDNSDDCTTQQAFYKFREAISTTLKIDKQIVSPDLLLADILPRQTRRSGTRTLEKHLGFKLDILRPPYWVTGTLIIILVLSIVGLFFNKSIGLSGLAFSIGGLWLAYKIGNELDLTTVGQVAEKMKRNNYLRSRRNPKTFNKKEIGDVLTEMFSDNLALDKSKLTRDAKLS